jgi:gentisate 1,2-dioxygenase
MDQSMPNTKSDSSAAALDEFYAELADHACEALWTMKDALTPEPVTQMTPFLWRYGEVRNLLLRAGDLVSVEDADRRVIAFKNPGASNQELARATDTLWAAIQLVLPGEEAPPHRHSPSALRYIIEGTGGYTEVDGVRVDMEPGDFLITPNWSWHGHGHGGNGPMIWLDGLDAPMVSTLRLVFAEFGGAPQSKGHMYSPVLRAGQVEPTWMDRRAFGTVVWKYDEVEAALADLRGEVGSPFDDVIVEYRNPQTGGPVLPTVAAYMQLLRPGVQTHSRRQTCSTVYHVVRGRGRTTINGVDFDWSTGDTFAVPVWANHAHANDTMDDALLFSYSDRPAVRALGLYRESAGG